MNFMMMLHKKLLFLFNNVLRNHRSIYFLVYLIKILIFLSFRNRLTIPACIEHKWLSLASGATNHRENAIFLTEKLRRFAHDFRQRCRAQTEIQQETIIEISKR